MVEWCSVLSGVMVVVDIFLSVYFNLFIFFFFSILLGGKSSRCYGCRTLEALFLLSRLRWPCSGIQDVRCQAS